MNIVYKNLKDIKPYENNPRKNEKAIEYVANSISEFGFRAPIMIDKDSVIVCGHTRYEAAKTLGMENVPCIMAEDLTDEQVKAYRIADNKISEHSAWDNELLTQELEELQGLDFDLSVLGFEEWEIDNFLNAISDDELQDFFEETEPKEKEPKKIQCPHCGEWFEQ